MLEYVIVGVVLVGLGAVQVLLRRRGWQGEDSPKWTVAIGPAAICLGVVAVAAGLLDW